MTAAIDGLLPALPEWFGCASDDSVDALIARGLLDRLQRDDPTAGDHKTVSLDRLSAAELDAIEALAAARLAAIDADG